MAQGLVRAAQWTAVFVAAFVGVIALLAAAAPGSGLVELLFGASALGVSFALFRRLRGSPVIDVPAVILALTPRRRWAAVVGPILALGAFLAIGVAAESVGEPGAVALLAVVLFGGVLFGFGADQPDWGWWGVATIALAIPTGTVLMLLSDTVSSGAPLPPGLVRDLAGLWLALAAVFAPTSLVGIGAHRLARRRLAPRPAASPGEKPGASERPHGRSSLDLASPGHR